MTQIHDIPAVVLTAEHPATTIRFGLSTTSAVDSVQVKLSIGGSDQVRLSRNGEPIEMATGSFTCTDDCLGDYRVDSTRDEDGPAQVVLSVDLDTTVESGPPLFPHVAFSDLSIDGGVTVVAEGTVDWIHRDWVALRAPQGLTDTDRFFLELSEADAGEARVLTATGLQFPNGQDPLPLPMPESCLSAPCGITITLESNTLIPGQRPDFQGESYAWRLLDYGAAGEPVQIDHRAEATPSTGLRHRQSAFELSPGQSVETTLHISIPAWLMEGADPDRPANVNFMTTGRAGDHSELVELAVTDAEGNQTSGVLNDYLFTGPVECAEPTTCDTELHIRTSLPATAGLSATVWLDTNMTFRLPHLLNSPHGDLVTVKEIR